MSKYYTDKQWLSLPRNLKLRWWKETNYGKLKPSIELLKEINEWLANQEHLKLK
jgi:hypothetical protein